MVARLIIPLACGVFAAATPMHAQQRLTGVVFDGLTKELLPGAWVAVLDTNSREEVARVASDARGQFSVEFASRTVTLVAGKSGFAQSAPMAFELVEGESDHALIGLRTLDETAIEVALAESRAKLEGRARVLGRVFDRETLRPVVGVEVLLGATGDRAITGGEGVFSLDEVAPGPNVIRTSHLGYGEQSRVVSLEAGSAYEITIRLTTKAIELEGIDVSVRSRSWAGRMDDVWARMNRGMGGHFILAEELEVRSGQPLNSILTSVPSLQMRSVTNGEGSADLWNQRIFLRNSCKAALWIDGIEVFNPGEDDMPGPPPPLQDFLRISTLDVAVIEVFPGPSSLPPEFARPGTKCAVSIWTKR